MGRLRTLKNQGFLWCCDPHPSLYALVLVLGGGGGVEIPDFFCDTFRILEDSIYNDRLGDHFVGQSKRIGCLKQGNNENLWLLVVRYDMKNSSVYVVKKIYIYIYISITNYEFNRHKCFSNIYDMTIYIVLWDTPVWSWMHVEILGIYILSNHAHLYIKTKSVPTGCAVSIFVCQKIKYWTTRTKCCITLRLLTPPMETPDPPNDTPGALKQVVLTPHDILWSLRVIFIAFAKIFFSEPKKILRLASWQRLSLPPRCKDLQFTCGTWGPTRRVIIWHQPKQCISKSFKINNHLLLLVGGFNPSEKYQSNWIVSPGSGENKKH